MLHVGDLSMGGFSRRASWEPIAGDITRRRHRLRSSIAGEALINNEAAGRIAE
jgi:hypothetical protein